MKRIIILTLAVYLGLTQQVFAQKKRPVPKPEAPTPAVKVVNNPDTQYLSGEVRVNVQGNEDVTIIRLGLAQNGASLIEFPRDDYFYAIHPPENADILKIEDSPTRLKDHYLLVRPGSSFLPSGKDAPSAAGTIHVQMTSGKVIIFMIYPVKDISQQAHRCAVLYDRKTIVTQRRAIGLAVNLDGKEDVEAPKASVKSEIVTKPAEAAQAEQKKTEETNLRAGQVEAVQPPVKQAEPAQSPAKTAVPVQSITPVKDLKVGKTPQRKTKSEPIVVEAPITTLPLPTASKSAVTPVSDTTAAWKSTSSTTSTPPVVTVPVAPLPEKQELPKPRLSEPKNGNGKLLGILPKDDPLSPATTWVGSKHGISAMAELAYLGAEQRMVKLWVRNVMAVPAKIVPGQPELWVYTRDNKGRTLQIEPVRITKIETTAQNGVIRGSGQEVFQLHFKAPILGVAQKLYVSIAQSNAADQPLLVEITVPGVR